MFSNEPFVYIFSSKNAIPRRFLLNIPSRPDASNLWLSRSQISVQSCANKQKLESNCRKRFIMASNVVRTYSHAAFNISTRNAPNADGVYPCCVNERQQIRIQAQRMESICCHGNESLPTDNESKATGDTEDLSVNSSLDTLAG